MQKLNFWQVDAFTKEAFKGNPAAVVFLEEALCEKLMQKIAMEMNVSETAFVGLRKEKNPYLRWFTPLCEIDLCGHATLSSAHIYFSHINKQAEKVCFDTRSVGPLTVTKEGGYLSMDFPSRPGDSVQLSDVPKFVIDALGGQMPVEARKARDLMLIYKNEDEILKMKPDFNALCKYPHKVIVTAPSKDKQHDCISRFFAPTVGVDEDPVTGSAHCTIAPYWASRLDKERVFAYQASKRGGELTIRVMNERLAIAGYAVTVLEGKLQF